MTDLTLQDIRNALDELEKEEYGFKCPKCNTRFDSYLVLGCDRLLCKCKADEFSKTEVCRTTAKYLQEMFNGDLK